MTNETRTPSPADGRRIIGYRNPAPCAAAPMVPHATDFSNWTPIYEGDLLPFAKIVDGGWRKNTTPQDGAPADGELIDARGLKACPFCGDDEELGTREQFGAWWAVCGNCGARTYAETERGAIRAWNERLIEAQSATIAGLNAEVEQWHSAYVIAHNQAMENGEAAFNAKAQLAALAPEEG